MLVAEIKRAMPSDVDIDDPFAPLTPAFISGCSDFPNFAALIYDSPWTIHDGDIVDEDGNEVLLEEMDEYLADYCRYDSWTELVEKAIECWDTSKPPKGRAKKRKQCEVDPVKVEYTYKETEGMLLDISVQGIGIRAPLMFRPGGWLKVTIPRRQMKKVGALPNRELRLRGLIRWAKQEESESRAGVELTARLM